MAESELNLFYSKVWTISELKKFQGLVYIHGPSGMVVRVGYLVSTGDTWFVRIRKMENFEPIIRDEKPKIISLSETLLKAKLFFETELLNLKKWKRFPELNRLLGGFR